MDDPAGALRERRDLRRRDYRLQQGRPARQRRGRERLHPDVAGGGSKAGQRRRQPAVGPGGPGDAAQGDRDQPAAQPRHPLGARRDAGVARRAEGPSARGADRGGDPDGDRHLHPQLRCLRGSRRRRRPRAPLRALVGSQRLPRGPLQDQRPGLGLRDAGRPGEQEDRALHPPRLARTVGAAHHALRRRRRRRRRGDEDRPLRRLHAPARPRGGAGARVGGRGPADRASGRGPHRGRRHPGEDRPHRARPTPPGPLAPRGTARGGAPGLGLR